LPAPQPAAAPAAASNRTVARANGPPEPGAAAYGRDANLAAERSLIDVARTSLSRGQAVAALDAAERHARKFPNGQLTEERESVYIQALVATDDYDAARARAARFRSRYPNSILLPVVENAIRSIP
jgi:hypothetical protein